MSSKGISPMVATILLIAFTVAVGGIISVWMTTYTRTAGAAVSEATEDQLRCVGSAPSIYSVTDKAVFIVNTGSENLFNVTCMSSDGKTLNVTEVLSSGGGYSFEWDVGTNTSVICIARCRSIGVRDECRKGQSCWAAP
ncbi:MAG: archaellin/type IV pilin N-terminal domain-containing protein [Candidatus Aenigmatarchaeota archaeon]